VTHEQPSLFGDAPAADVGLGPVQALVMGFVREHGTISKDEAGQLAHAHAGRHPADATCAYCAIRGADVLRSLLGRELVERAAEGLFQLPKAQVNLPDDEIPY
jgi:hypothetical protein